MAIRNQFTSKAYSVTKLLGCDYLTFKKHIESKFTEDMNWEKVISGEIHIDHIIPCSNFDLTNEQEQLRCFNYLNQQPLWKRDNLIKHNK
jgi:hypothetical protein